MSTNDTRNHRTSQIFHEEIALRAERAWVFNCKGEQTARQLMERYPVGRRLYAGVVSQNRVNLLESLFDQGRLEEAWDQMQSLEEPSRSQESDLNRHQWESRMHYLSAQIVLARGDLAQAEPFIRQNPETVRRLHAKKREGGFPQGPCLCTIFAGRPSGTW